MILPLHEQVRARVRDALARLHGITRCRPRRFRSNTRPTARWAISARRSRSTWRAACARRRAPSRRSWPARSARCPASRASTRRRTATSTCFSIGPRSCCARLGLAGTLPAPPARPEKTIVEHTAINPNKAAHIGHLRNSALGDTLVRVLRFRGNPVEVQNYIDDTGVQVADVVVGFQRAREARPRRREAHRRRRRASTTTAGTSTRASPSGTTATRSA